MFKFIQSLLESFERNKLYTRKQNPKKPLDLKLILNNLKGDKTLSKYEIAPSVYTYPISPRIDYDLFDEVKLHDRYCRQNIYDRLKLIDEEFYYDNNKELVDFVTYQKMKFEEQILNEFGEYVSSDDYVKVAFYPYFLDDYHLDREMLFNFYDGKTNKSFSMRKKVPLINEKEYWENYPIFIRSEKSNVEWEILSEENFPKTLIETKEDEEMTEPEIRTSDYDFDEYKNFETMIDANTIGDLGRQNDEAQIVCGIDQLIQTCHDDAVEAGWWNEDETLVEDFENFLDALGFSLDTEAMKQGEVFIERLRNLKRKYEMALIAQKIALIHSEISEALEAHRKNLMDDKLPNYKGITVEFGDALVRIADVVGYLQRQDDSLDYEENDLAQATVDKVGYNRTRNDHKMENRMKDGGKSY